MGKKDASPLPVKVANTEPLQVEVSKDAAPEPVVTPAGKLTLPPTTTAEQDIVTAGQRRVNLIWEFTQSSIAVLITLAIVYTAIAGIPSDNLANGFFLIIGFYFSRVNHQAIGGVGPKANEEQPYRGR